METIPKLDIHIVGVPRGSEQAKVAAYRQEPYVEFAELDYGLHAATTPKGGR